MFLVETSTLSIREAAWKASKIDNLVCVVLALIKMYRKRQMLDAPPAQLGYLILIGAGIYTLPSILNWYPDWNKQWANSISNKLFRVGAHPRWKEKYQLSWNSLGHNRQTKLTYDGHHQHGPCCWCFLMLDPCFHWELPLDMLNTFNIG